MVGYTDEEWADAVEDVPALDNPFIQQYLQGRQSLIDEEDKKRSGEYLPLLSGITWL